MKTLVLILLALLQPIAASSFALTIYDFATGQTNIPADLTNAVDLAAGKAYGLVVKSDGSLVNLASAYMPSGLSNVVDVATGYSDAVALMGDGTLVAWHTPDHAGGDNFVPPPADLSNVVAVAGGGYASLYGFSEYLALRGNGTVTGWGIGYPGNPVPTGLSNVRAITVNYFNGVALKSDGTVACWGSDAPYMPVGLSNVVAITTYSSASSAASSWSMAVLSNGTVVCWGQGATNPPAGLTNVVGVAAGLAWGLAVKGDGTVQGWGNIQVPLDLPYTLAVSASRYRTMALIDPTATASPPVITKQPSPSNQAIALGASITLWVEAKGFGPLGYQWYFGTNIIAGAVTGTLTLTNVHTWQSGEYHVVVTNSAGSTQSQSTFIEVLPYLTGLDMVPRIALVGEIGYIYYIQYITPPAPTNAWQAITEVMITNQPQYYFDLSAIGQAARLYRLVQSP